MKISHRRWAACFVICFVAFQILVSAGGRAQGDPPWKTPGHPFFNNPIGYARDLHRRYVGNQATLTENRAALPTLKRENTGAETSGLGFFDALRDAAEVARRRKETQQKIVEGELTRSELEREWAKWCELGLLGSPMPPLSAANELIEDESLDRSTSPPVRRFRLVDRIDFNLRYFLEEKPATATPPAGGPGGGAFPKVPFNGLQITYNIGGATLAPPSDGGPFEGWVRTYGGSMQGGTLRVSGTVTKGTGSSKEYPGHATISVSAGDKKVEKSVLLDGGTSAAYDLSVEIPAGATAGKVYVHVYGDYRNGEMRFVQVVANLKGRAPGGAAAPPVEPGKAAPGTVGRPSDLPWGRIYPGKGPLQLVPAGRPETERVDIATNLPLSWVAGDRLITGPGNPALLAFPFDIRAVIGANSKLELRKNGAYLGVGSALCDLLKPGWPFKLSTPAATLQAENSLFAAQVLEDGTTLIAVGIGTATVADAAGRNAVTVRAGSYARIAPGVGPSGPEPLPQRLAQSLFADAGLLLPSPGTASGKTEPPPPRPDREVTASRLDSPAASYALGRDYPARDFRFIFEVTYEKPGTILDTVGINAASPGAFALQVGPDGTATFLIFDPNTNSAVRDANGWHRLSVKTALQPKTPALITIERQGTELQISVGPPGSAKKAAVTLVTPLSGQPAFLGNFPGDDHLGAGYDIHPGIIGTVKVLKFAP